MFEKFIEEVQRQIKDYLPKKYRNATFLLQSVLKNNATSKRGLSIVTQEGITPVIYLESYFDDLVKGKPFPKVLKEISAAYIQAANNPPTAMSTQIGSLTWAKDYLMLFIINKDKNQELLSTLPHETVADLAVACHLSLPTTEAGCICRTIVTHTLMETWGINAQQLFERARENTLQMHSFTLCSMEDTILELMGVRSAENLLEETLELSPEEPMYVLTNENKSYGTTALLYPGVMNKIEQLLPGGYYILPSSIHETIIVGKQSFSSMHPKDLRQMVQEINATQLEPEDVLSDQIYTYDQMTQQIKTVPIK